MDLHAADRRTRWRCSCRSQVARGNAKDRPVHFQVVFATLYHNMGIDLSNTTVKDLQGRPHYLVDAGYEPMKEVV